MKSFLKPIRVAAVRVRRPVAIALLAVVAGTALADNGWTALIAYDGFNYTPVGSELRAHSGGGSFGFATPWSTASLNSYAFDIGGGSLLSSVSGNLPTTGNRASVPAFGTSNRDIARQLTVPLGTSGTTAYLSFLMRPEVVIGGPGITDGWLGFVMRGSGDVHIGRESFSSVYRIEGNSSVIAHSSTPLVLDETRFLVLRADFAAGNDTYSLFIDPVPGLLEPAIPDAVLSSFDAGMITRVVLTGPGAFSFDELRIGDTFADVTPTVAGLVPSNASLNSASDVNVLNLDFGAVGLGSSPAGLAFEVANLMGVDPAAFLVSESEASSGDTSTLTTDFDIPIGVVGGDSESFNASFDTSVPGSFDATYEFDFTDILGTDQTLTLNLSGEVTITDDPDIPDLIYDAATGEVILDPDASSIIGYVLKNTTNSFLSAGHTPILGGVSTSLSSEISEASFSGPAIPTSIGSVFPTGMDITQLFNFLSVNEVSRSFGSPLVPFDLIVIPVPVPEPSTYVMAAIGLLGLGLLGRRHKGGWRRKAGGREKLFVVAPMETEASVNCISVLGSNVMKWIGRVVMVWAAVLVLGNDAQAVPITITFTGAGSGTIGSTPFTNASFTITGLGDTDDRGGIAGNGFSILHDSTSIDINGVGSFEFSTPMATFVNSAAAKPGLSKAFGGSDRYHGESNPVFSTWDMLSSIGPIPGDDFRLLSWESSPVLTDGGALVFDTEWGIAGTFEANVVPEPSTYAMAVMGLLGLGFIARRRKGGWRCRGTCPA